jgi:hypothetical protein
VQKEQEKPVHIMTKQVYISIRCRKLNRLQNEEEEEAAPFFSMFVCLGKKQSSLFFVLQCYGVSFGCQEQETKRSKRKDKKGLPLPP